MVFLLTIQPIYVCRFVHPPTSEWIVQHTLHVYNTVLLMSTCTMRRECVWVFVLMATLLITWQWVVWRFALTITMESIATTPACKTVSHCSLMMFPRNVLRYALISTLLLPSNITANSNVIMANLSTIRCATINAMMACSLTIWLDFAWHPVLMTHSHMLIQSPRSACSCALRIILPSVWIGLVGLSAPKATTNNWIWDCVLTPV